MGNIFEKLDNKLLAMRLEQMMEMLKTKSPQELQQRFANVDRQELMKKLNEIDAKKLKEMNIDPAKIKNSLTQADIEKIKILAGKDSDAVMKKLNELAGTK